MVVCVIWGGLGVSIAKLKPANIESFGKVHYLHPLISEIPTVADFSSISSPVP